MQTFLPYADFKKSAEVLDFRRLGKQRVETFQLLNALNNKSKGWVNHPAALMWKGYEKSLTDYGIVITSEWIRRGYKDSMLPKFIELPHNGITPPWFGREEIHASHRSNLLRKNFEFYSKFGWKEPDNLPYIWGDLK